MNNLMCCQIMCWVYAKGCGWLEQKVSACKKQVVAWPFYPYSGAWPVLSLGLITKVAQKVLPWPWTQSTASESKSEQPNVAKSPA